MAEMLEYPPGAFSNIVGYAAEDLRQVPKTGLIQVKISVGSYQNDEFPPVFHLGRVSGSATD